MSGDLRAAVEGLPLFPPPGLKIGPLVQVDRVLALIPEGAVLVTEETLAAALDGLTWIEFWHEDGRRTTPEGIEVVETSLDGRQAAAAILRHLREGDAPAKEMRERIVVEMENEGVVTWGDEGHRARFLASGQPE